MYNKYVLRSEGHKHIANMIETRMQEMPKIFTGGQYWVPESFVLEMANEASEYTEEMIRLQINEDAEYVKVS